MRTVLIASGGTGGHIFPGILLAKRLEENYKVYFVGNKDGMEYEIVMKNGYDFLHIPSFGFVGKGAMDKFKSVFMNIVSFSKSILYVLKYKPVFVVGTGSFTEIPVGFAAKFMGKKLFVTEQDSYPGIATRVLSLIADRVLLSYENSKSFFRRKDNLFVVGTLTESVVINKSAAAIKKELGIDFGMRVLFIFGGSRGASSINEVTLKMVKSGMPQDIFIIWQTGKNNFERINKDLNGVDFNGTILPFIYNMPEIYTVSDLVVARSGACSLAELSDYKKAAILIPFPYAAHDHQMKNARYYEEKGSALVISEEKLTMKLFKKTILDLIYDNNRLKEMGEKSGQLHDSGVVDKAIKILLGSKNHV